MYTWHIHVRLSDLMDRGSTLLLSYNYLKCFFFLLREKIVDLIEANKVAVLSGETGCGKTTQVRKNVYDRAVTKFCSSLKNIKKYPKLLWQGIGLFIKVAGNVN